MEVIEFKNVVWDMTRRISECMDGMFRPISEQYGLTHMQMRILMELWSAEDSPTIGQLGRTLGMTSGNMSSMCKRLEQEGFLLRVRDLQDERMVKIALSEIFSLPNYMKTLKDNIQAIDVNFNESEDKVKLFYTSNGRSAHTTLANLEKILPVITLEEKFKDDDTQLPKWNDLNKFTDDILENIKKQIGYTPKQLK